MELNTFLENFRDQFDETDPTEIQASTVFKEIEEWSSLIALCIIAMADSEYNFKLKGDDIRSSNTVEDLYNIILDKKKQ